MQRLSQIPEESAFVIGVEISVKEGYKYSFFTPNKYYRICSLLFTPLMIKIVTDLTIPGYPCFCSKPQKLHSIYLPASAAASLSLISLFSPVAGNCAILN